jgi:HAD superfamily hydrolase (TIGR01484 family)
MAEPQPHIDLWLRRKVSSAIWVNASNATRDKWRAAAESWRAKLEVARFGGVIIDYDGTLCEEGERLTQPSKAVASVLTKLVRSGLEVGVATGRGKSIVASLRRTLPASLWTRVHIAMYNGARVSSLGDDEASGSAKVPSDALLSAAEKLNQSELLGSVAKIDTRTQQVTVRERQAMPRGTLFRIVSESLGEPLFRELRIVSSGGTVDVVDVCASKAKLLDQVRQRMTEGRELLSIGDQGQFGGNDYALLSHAFGLSVDQTSSDFDTCWNIAPAGARRTDALLVYLRALKVTRKGEAVLQLAALQRVHSQAANAS